MVDRLAIAGMTVGEARTLLSVPYNIAPDAGMLVNGDRVGPRHRLQPGEALEFVREGGEKG
jgi:hypothetical protein